MNISKINKYNVLGLYVVITVLLFLLSCGSTIKDPEPGSGKGKVALFITDNISFYKQVVTTVTAVRLINSGVPEVCEVLRAPVTLDVANLTDVAQYVDLTECPAGRYNRMDIDIRKDVHLMDQLGAASACVFNSVLDANGVAEPLACDAATGLCTVSIRGGVRDGWLLIQEDRYNDLGIDFNLKQFMVTDFGSPSTCSVTIAAATISSADLNASGRAHSVTGPIVGLNTAAKTFTLVASGASITVDYSGINPALQPNIDVLLQTARSEGLKVNVLTGGIDLETAAVSANRIFVKAAGAVSNITNQPQWSFTLELLPGTTLKGSHKPPAVVQGAFTDGIWVDVKFDGYNADNDEFIAAAVEVLPAGMVLDD